MPDGPADRPGLLGMYLVDRGILSATSLDRATRVGVETGEGLPGVLTRLGLVSERDVASAMSDFFGMPFIGSEQFPDVALLEGTFSRPFLKEAQFIPIADAADTVTIAVADPTKDRAIAAIHFAVDKNVIVGVACRTDIEAAYQRLYGDGKDGTRPSFRSADESPESSDQDDDDIVRLRDSASEAPVIRFVNHLINRAVDHRASDIHIEPMDGEMRIRYRIDGLLQDVEAPSPTIRAAIVSRIKIMARLNIAERRLAQDGRVRLAIRGKDIDFRVSTVPTIYGESVVLRILDRGELSLDFPALGLTGSALAAYQRALKEPHGIVLVTGPTGSGKTTTLYASLLQLNTPDKKILTIEDPVEYRLHGINQVQVKPQIGLTFASALRSFLRQDPDIMMIGEIRDLETAQIAVQAALTGHLILSTLHTNEAATAITRMLDMGIEDYLVTSTVNAFVAQRLVRTLCEACKAPCDLLPELAKSMELERFTGTGPTALHRAVGCDLCSCTGYRGRNAIFEVLPMSDQIRQLVLRHADAQTIRQAAIEQGMETMYAHGIREALAGSTTIEEILRVTREL